jgi:hypothetical protein
VVPLKNVKSDTVRALEVDYLIPIVPIVIVPLDRNDIPNRLGIITSYFHTHTSQIESVYIRRDLSTILGIDVVENGAQQITHSECGFRRVLNVSRHNYTVAFFATDFIAETVRR